MSEEQDNVPTPPLTVSAFPLNAPGPNVLFRQLLPESFHGDGIRTDTRRGSVMVVGRHPVGAPMRPFCVVSIREGMQPPSDDVSQSVIATGHYIGEHKHPNGIVDHYFVECEDFDLGDLEEGDEIDVDALEAEAIETELSKSPESPAEGD